MIVRFDTPELAEKRFKELAEKHGSTIEHSLIHGAEHYWFTFENQEHDFEAVYTLMDGAIDLVFYLGMIDQLQDVWATQKLMREV